MSLASRAHELTAVLNRERFDEPPGDITDPVDLRRWTEFRAEYHRAQSLVSTSPFPLQIDFELNSDCTMTCGFCLHGHTKVAKKRLPFDTFKRVIDEGKKHGLCSIKLNYINEPLMVRDLPDYVAYAKNNGVLNVFFATNGQLLSAEMGRRLIEARLSKLMVSLDAASSSVFQVMRNSKHFDRIVRNVEQFIELRKSLGVSYPLVRVNFLKSSRNIHEAEEFVKHWANKADVIGLQDYVGLPGVESDVGSVALRPDPKTFRCSFPFKLMVVDSDGNILPCCTFSGREMPVGHIDETTIEQAWNSVQARALKKQHKDGAELNPICVHCIGSSSNE